MRNPALLEIAKSRLKRALYLLDAYKAGLLSSNDVKEIINNKEDEEIINAITVMTEKITYINNKNHKDKLC